MTARSTTRPRRRRRRQSALTSAVAGGGSGHLAASGNFTADPNESGLIVRFFANSDCSGTAFAERSGLTADPAGLSAFSFNRPSPNQSAGFISLTAESSRGAIGPLARSRSPCSLLPRGVPTLTSAEAGMGVGQAFLSVSGQFAAGEGEGGLSLRLFDNASCSGESIGEKSGLSADGNRVVAPISTTPSRRSTRGQSFQLGRVEVDCGPGCSNAVTVTGLAAPGKPQLFGAVPGEGLGGGFLGVAGLFSASADEHNLSLRLFASADCAGPPLTQMKTGLFANHQGFAAFAVDDAFPTLADGTFVSAQARRGGPAGTWSGCSNWVVVGPNNTSWPAALTIGENATKAGYLQSQARR